MYRITAFQNMQGNTHSTSYSASDGEAPFKHIQIKEVKFFLTGHRFPSLPKATPPGYKN